jgi:hypothetical protein
MRTMRRCRRAKTGGPGKVDLSPSFLSIRNDAYPDARARQSGLNAENLKPVPRLPGLSPDMEDR